jgi:putative ABC transport system ATP-binding protein
MGQHVIEAKEIKKNYIKGKSVIEAIKNISLTVDRGEFVSIIGPSGSGKSTLLHLLGVLDTPTEGNIVINGNDLSKINRSELSKIRRSIGFVFQ